MTAGAEPTENHSVYEYRSRVVEITEKKIKADSERKMRRSKSYFENPAVNRVKIALPNGKPSGSTF